MKVGHKIKIQGKQVTIKAIKGIMSTSLRSYLKARLVSGSLIITIPKSHREAIGLERGDIVYLETDLENKVITIRVDR